MYATPWRHCTGRELAPAPGKRHDLALAQSDVCALSHGKSVMSSRSPKRHQPQCTVERRRASRGSTNEGEQTEDAPIETQKEQCLR
jgi:hypothetical protein